jgi:hypothetical protein
MKKVVVTHYLPSYQSVNARWKDSDINCAFVGNCEDILSDPWAPELWIHGHTHDSCDYVYPHDCADYATNSTRVVCNPYGYKDYEVNKNFIPDLIVEI